MAISGSGNSPNVLAAVDWASRHGLTTFGMTGYNGGKLKQMADAGIHVPLDDMGMVESVHICVIHWIVDDMHARVNSTGRYAHVSSHAANCDHHWGRAGGVDHRLRVAPADRYRADRAGGRGLCRRHIADGQLQGQSHRYRRPSLLFQVGPRDGVVARSHADRAGAAGAGHDQLPAEEPRRGDGSRGARPGEVRPCHAPAAAEEPHLFSSQVLRLSDHAEPRHDQEARPAADHEDRLQLPSRGPVPFPAGEEPGRVLHQPLRPRAVSHVLQVVYGEGLGRALFGHQRRMGSAARQGLVDPRHA